MAEKKPLKRESGKMKQFASTDTVPPSNLPYVTAPLNFGDGSDGAVTISVNTTLTRTMYYDTLVVNAGVVLTTAGFKIYCKTSFQNLGTVGSVGVNANPGGNGTVSAGGGAGANGTALAIGEFLATAAGGAGGAGGTITPAVGTGGVAGGNPNCLVSGSANRSGAGGSAVASGGAAGASGLGIGNNIYRPVRHFTHNYLFGILLLGTGRGGSGGGGGGGSAAGGGGGGGGGGSASHPVWICTYSFDNQGIIRSNGGNGGNGGNGFGNGGGGGYGGGACGGVVIVAYWTLTNTGTIQVLKGSNGTSGNGAGSGTSGAVAVIDATDGYYQIFNLATGTVTTT